MKHIVNHNHPHCNGPAFKYDHEPTAGEKIDRECVSTLKGTRVPMNATGMACGSCGRRLRAAQLAPGINEYDMGSDHDMNTIYGEYHEHNH